MASRTDILNWDQTSGVPWNLFGGTALASLSQVLVTQFPCVERQSLPPTWKLYVCNLCQLGHEGFCSVPGSESLVDQTVV